MSFPEVEEYDHFGKPAYRVKKKIFVTLSLDDKRAVVKLSKSEQPEICDKYPSAVAPVKNKWGELGWTNVELNKVSEKMMIELLYIGWRNVAPKTLSKKLKMN